MIMKLQETGIFESQKFTSTYISKLSDPNHQGNHMMEMKINLLHIAIVPSLSQVTVHLAASPASAWH